MASPTCIFNERETTLESGGKLTLKASNIFMMSRKDRAFVLDLLDQMIDYEDALAIVEIDDDEEAAEAPAVQAD